MKAPETHPSILNPVKQPDNMGRSRSIGPGSPRLQLAKLRAFVDDCNRTCEAALTNCSNGRLRAMKGTAGHDNRRPQHQFAAQKPRYCMNWNFRSPLAHRSGKGLWPDAHSDNVEPLHLDTNRVISNDRKIQTSLNSQRNPEILSTMLTIVFEFGNARLNSVSLLSFNGQTDKSFGAISPFDQNKDRCLSRVALVLEHIRDITR